jgi:MFS family permease
LSSSANGCLPIRATWPAAASTAVSVGGASAALLLAVLSFSLLQTFVVPTLPALRSSLGVDTTTVSWVLSAFLVSSSVGTVILGRLGDLFGRKPLMLVSLGILALGSLLAALSSSIGVLIVARAIQGLGAGTFPLAFGLVREIFPRERVAVMIGTISAVFGIGFGLGLVLPGPLMDAFGWPSLFWASFILVGIAAAAVIAFIYVPAQANKGRIDWIPARVSADRPEGAAPPADHRGELDRADHRLRHVWGVHPRAPTGADPRDGRIRLRRHHRWRRPLPAADGGHHAVRRSAGR